MYYYLYLLQYYFQKINYHRYVQYSCLFLLLKIQNIAYNFYQYLKYQTDINIFLDFDVKRSVKIGS